MGDGRRETVDSIELDMMIQHDRCCLKTVSMNMRER